jgi:ArsR family transcriptional regulator
VCACTISERLGLAASTISHHMALLREAGLVHARKQGTWVYYSLDRARLREVARAIAEL